MVSRRPERSSSVLRVDWLREQPFDDYEVDQVAMPDSISELRLSPDSDADSQASFAIVGDGVLLSGHQINPRLRLNLTYALVRVSLECLCAFGPNEWKHNQSKVQGTAFAGISSRSGVRRSVDASSCLAPCVAIAHPLSSLGPVADTCIKDPLYRLSGQTSSLPSTASLALPDSPLLGNPGQRRFAMRVSLQ